MKSPEFLLHIQNELKFLSSEAKVLTEEGFQEDEKAKRAFARSFEVIGEISKNIPETFRKRYPDIPWKLVILTYSL